MNRLSQFQTKVTVCGASDRDYLAQEIGFLVLPDGTLLHHLDFSNHISKYPKHKMVYLLKSIHKENKYYKPEMKGHTRGFFHRTGFCVENIDKNKSKISVIGLI